jgi:mono/diheme cytochrome c family protein
MNRSATTMTLVGAALVLLFAVAFMGVAAIRRGFSARDNPSWVEMFIAKSVRSMAVPAKARIMRNPIPNTETNLAEARSHWADHCATCHGNDGGGKTTIGQNLYPKAPDMRLPATQSKTDGELYYTIQNGIRLTGMPAWGQVGENDTDSWKLVQFIRHLPQVTLEEVEQMKKINPKTLEEFREQQEEEEFLNEDRTGQQATEPTHHHH